MSKPRKVNTILAIIFILFLALWLPSTAFIQDTLAPIIFRIFLLTRDYLLGRPERIYWLIFSVIVILVFNIQLLLLFANWLLTTPDLNVKPTTLRQGRIRHYEKLLRYYADSPFSRQQLAADLTRMVMQSADQPERTYLAIERLISENEIALPPEVIAFITHTKNTAVADFTPWYRRLQKRFQPPTPDSYLSDTDLFATLDYLEEKLNLTADEDSAI